MTPACATEQTVHDKQLSAINVHECFSRAVCTAGESTCLKQRNTGTAGSEDNEPLPVLQRPKTPTAGRQETRTNQSTPLKHTKQT